MPTFHTNNVLEQPLKWSELGKESTCNGVQLAGVIIHNAKGDDSPLLLEQMILERTLSYACNTAWKAYKTCISNARAQLDQLKKQQEATGSRHRRDRDSLLPRRGQKSWEAVNEVKVRGKQRGAVPAESDLDSQLSFKPSSFRVACWSCSGTVPFDSFVFAFVGKFLTKNQPTVGSLKAKIASFEQKGSVPKPQGRLGTSPPLPSGTASVSARSRELYANRMAKEIKPSYTGRSQLTTMSTGSSDRGSHVSRLRDDAPTTRPADILETHAFDSLAIETCLPDSPGGSPARMAADAASRSSGMSSPGEAGEGISTRSPTSTRVAGSTRGISTSPKLPPSPLRGEGDAHRSASSSFKGPKSPGKSPGKSPTSPLRIRTGSQTHQSTPSRAQTPSSPSPRTPPPSSPRLRQTEGITDSASKNLIPLRTHCTVSNAARTSPIPPPTLPPIGSPPPPPVAGRTQSGAGHNLIASTLNTVLPSPSLSVSSPAGAVVRLPSRPYNGYDSDDDGGDGPPKPPPLSAYNLPRRTGATYKVVVHGRIKEDYELMRNARLKLTEHGIVAEPIPTASPTVKQQQPPQRSTEAGEEGTDIGSGEGAQSQEDDEYGPHSPRARTDSLKRLNPFTRGHSTDMERSATKQPLMSPSPVPRMPTPESMA
ncbi:hypothetical protein FISHEDRAFT_56238 [Fistulina hepatica ATCC 64428]|uniref:Uncharacterized protein n=1 Tax=Fistulina hepatica ATCC 64428 TaxID=1128425 RepID=A0A0D7AJF9_9AGAR|nr:hypothetical protein FISHEDRAFT_56238 [Fistulina hepatica ATCC 64428]